MIITARVCKLCRQGSDVNHVFLLDSETDKQWETFPCRMQLEVLLFLISFRLNEKPTQVHIVDLCFLLFYDVTTFLLGLIGESPEVPKLIWHAYANVFSEMGATCCFHDFSE